MSKSVNKIKKIEKNNMTFLEIKSIKGQQLDQVQVEAISKNKIEGLLPMSLKGDDKSFKLIYNITGMISLRNYLQSTQLTKQLFGFLLQNILNIWQTLDANYFSMTGLLLDFGKVKVEPSSKRLYYIYLPIQHYDNGVNIKDFLLDILNNCSFAPCDDYTFVEEYLRILNTGVNFSIFELEEYISALTGVQKRTTATKKCPNCGKIVSADANFCTECQYSWLKKGITGPTGMGTYDPLNDNNDDYYTDEEVDWGNFDDGVVTLDNYDEVDSGNNDVDDSLSYTEDNSNPITLSGADDQVDISLDSNDDLPNDLTDEIGTTVLGDDLDDDDDIATTVLSAEKIIIYTGYLTRISNNEKKKIDKNLYRVGRNSKNDFIISDNTAVGREHAIIVAEDDHFYINDQNSTNKTYVNGNVIDPKINVEIFDDTSIKLANEDFLFNIEIIEK